jgi:hypothetical protein
MHVRTASSVRRAQLNTSCVVELQALEQLGSVTFRYAIFHARQSHACDTPKRCIYVLLPLSTCSITSSALLYL